MFPDYFYKLILTIELLFVIGGIAISVICRKKSKETKKKQWLKYWSYVIIVHSIVLTVWEKTIFIPLCIVITVIGLVEVIKITIQTPVKMMNSMFFIIGYILTASLFVGFSKRISSELILFVYLVVAIFDAFSQITGQLFGRHKLAPTISPAKTIEGAVGGCSCAILLGFGLHSFLAPSLYSPFLIGCIIAISSLSGDLTSSWYKRLHNVKDFSNWLPGQGGILDRFNSFIASAATIFIISMFRTFHF
jgi:phosphatidate cytidylyltransferase